MAEIDAMQYLDGGPCVQTVHDGTQREETITDLLDEERWALFARASAAAGVASTLSLPVMEQGRVVGGINLYASSSDAFSGHSVDLATALGASAVEAVTNADLAFDSRRRAEQAPARLRVQQALDVATGILAARDGARHRDGAVPAARRGRARGDQRRPGRGRADQRAPRMTRAGEARRSQA